MSTTRSNIRVSVQWKEQTVFAGEDIQCAITFRNAAHTQGETDPRAIKTNGFAPADRRRRSIPSLSNGGWTNGAGYHSRQSSGQPRGHRPTLSLNVPVNSRRKESFSHGLNGGSRSSSAHKRSVSIISMGSADLNTETNHGDGVVDSSRRPGRAHLRSASLQIMPRSPDPGTQRPPTAPLGNRSMTTHSPLMQSSAHMPARDPQEFAIPARPAPRQPGVNPKSSSGLPRGHRKGSSSLSQNFQFPSSETRPSKPLDMNAQFDPNGTIAKEGTLSRERSTRLSDTLGNSDHLPPATRIISGGSNSNLTPRSSGEFYSVSNNSTETLASEYVSRPPTRALPRSDHNRRLSNLNPYASKPTTETIMMGYAQIMGSFTLDGSLINQAPFEDVKRRGVVGGQAGGGVVGVEKSKRDSGILGAFGWGSIGASLGDILGGGELSSIKEMRGIASSKSIPLLSTPKSILFVDLQLAPGESKSYSYTFTLPKGLPPSHKGKAIKISYGLTIGTQRAGSERDRQHLQHVDIPFRVLGGVNSRGEILGHDLMSPYIILQDRARTSSMSDDPVDFFTHGDMKPDSKGRESSARNFLSYVDNLLERPRKNSSMGLLSPTEHGPSRKLSSVGEPTTSKDAIDLAILRSNLASSNQSSNRFEIARSGRRVASITLARAAYRLGETATAIIDFTSSDIPCYAIQATLESSERVNSAIALRSSASVYRFTRRIHASFSSCSIFSRRLTFSPTIPSNSTPEFVTSGVSLGWNLKIEFIVPRLSTTGEDDDEPLDTNTDLLEMVSKDERGEIFAAAEGLRCESFEISIPIKVYGTMVGGQDDVQTEALVI